MIIKEWKSLPTVELHIYPPLSYKLTTKKVGPLILRQKIQPGTTLVDLLDRLDNENHDSWRQLYNRDTKKMFPPIQTIVNKMAVSPSKLGQLILADGDQITFIFIIGGG